MAASGRFARGTVMSALNLINLSSHTVSSKAMILKLRKPISCRLDLNHPPTSSECVETWRLNMNYAIGVATQYSTASEATGCRHSIIARTLETVVECRHPVASLAVLY